MIEPASHHRVVSLGDELLPPCWLRRAETKPDGVETPGPSLFRIGPQGTFHRTLIAAIDGAHEVVLLASFLLADDELAKALERAAGRGVRVYALTASEHRLATVPKEDESFEARMIDDHKRLLNSLAGKVLLRSSEHFHAKFLVVDPASEARAWVSTANFNLALRESVELGVALDAPAAQALAGWFSWAFWQEAEHELAGKGRLAQVGSPPATPRIPNRRGVVVTTSSHQLLREEVLRLIRGAERELWVSSYGLEAGHAAVEGLLEKARQGLPVTVITRPRPAVHPALMVLAAAGARIIGHDKLHAKAVLSDAGALVMTANLEAQGLDRGFEVGIRLDGPASAALRRTFHQWAEAFPWSYAPRTRRGEHLGELWLADRGARDGRRQVIQEEKVTLRPVLAPSALDLSMAGVPELKLPEPGAKLPQRVRFEWRVEPPRLPEKAKERQRTIEREEIDKEGEKRVVKDKESYDPPVYEQGGRRFVLLRTPEDIEPARRLAAELDATVVVR